MTHPLNPFTPQRLLAARIALTTTFVGTSIMSTGCWIFQHDKTAVAPPDASGSPSAPAPAPAEAPSTDITAYIKGTKPGKFGPLTKLAIGMTKEEAAAAAPEFNAAGEYSPGDGDLRMRFLMNDGRIEKLEALIYAGTPDWHEVFTTVWGTGEEVRGASNQKVLAWYNESERLRMLVSKSSAGNQVTIEPYLPLAEVLTVAGDGKPGGLLGEMFAMDPATIRSTYRPWINEDKGDKITVYYSPTEYQSPWAPIWIYISKDAVSHIEIALSSGLKSDDATGLVDALTAILGTPTVKQKDKKEIRFFRAKDPEITLHKGMLGLTLRISRKRSQYFF